MSNRNKSGLHKEISSIFSGVPLPSDKANGPLMNMEKKKDNTAGHIPPVPSAALKGPQLIQQEPSKSSPETQDKAVPITEKTASAQQEKSDAVAVTKKTHLRDSFRSLNKSLKPLLEKLKTPPEGVSQKKHMATLVSVPILLLVVVFVFGRLLLKSGSGSKNSKGDDTGILEVAPKTQIDWKIPEVYPVGLRDPMKKGYRQSVTTVADDEPTADNSGIVVRGIAWSEDNPAAIIGTEIYYQGQAVNDAKIIKITTDSVEFEKEGKTWIQKVSN
jgi:hypothetical protein